MKLTAVLCAACLGVATIAVAHAAPNKPTVPTINEHCETRCILDHQTCESDVSDSLDECESSCDEDMCSKCQETMDSAELEQCHSNCDHCKSQCDSSADPRHQGCDSTERQCLSKCNEDN